MKNGAKFTINIHFILIIIHNILVNTVNIDNAVYSRGVDKIDDERRNAQ